MPYHKTHIKKGTLGQFSKIIEEFEELKDAHNQGSKIMEFIELSDLLGAIEAYIKPNGLELYDLILMKDITVSAFKDGTRK